MNRIIGGGAMGEVFEIEHQTMGRRLALKSLRLRLGAEPPAADRMRIEARTEPMSETRTTRCRSERCDQPLSERARTPLAHT